MKNLKRNVKGITLIALVISIIILIILAGVSLNLALGENGIFVKSKQAVDKYKDEAQKEQNTLENIYQDMQAETGGGAGETGKVPYLPDGFAKVEEETEEGVTIIKGPDESEFVWIPVETPVAENDDDLQAKIAEGQYPTAVKIDGQTDGLDDYRGVLYDFALNDTTDGVTITPKEYSANSGIREPANLNTTYDNANKLIGWTDTMYQKEYNELVKSVIANGGFYIGRYESSVNSTKVASKKSQDSMAFTTWYDMYTRQKNIYEGVSTAKTHMIWGSQWDQVMIYLKDVQNNNEGAKKKFFILDSTGMGKYGGSRVSTGTNPNYEVKGIYDLAGNVYEWTMEADGSTFRVIRGGNYSYTASSYPASYRGNTYPNNNNLCAGSRLTLYK